MAERCGQRGQSSRDQRLRQPADRQSRQLGRRLQRLAIWLLAVAALGLAGISHTPLSVTSAGAVGSYDNAAIADKALSYVGKWGGEACRDAGKLDASNPRTVAGYGAGQCRTFLNCILWMVSGGKQYPTGTYFQSFLDNGGSEISDVNALVKGDVIQSGDGIHTFIILSRKDGNQFNVVDSNYDNKETVLQHDLPVTLSSNMRAFRMGTTSLVGSIVQWDGDTNNPKASWLIGPDRRRRWIASAEMYACLRSKGAPDRGPQSASTLQQFPDLTNVWAECQTFWPSQGLSIGAPYGSRVYYPLQFSYRIKNITRQPASIKRLTVAVRGPAGDPLDVQCQNGSGISLQPGQEFTCSAVLGSGYGSAGTYTMWADWLDYNDRWHRGELGQPTTFSLAGPDRTLLAVQSVSVGAPQGFRAFRPLQFSFRVRNVSGGAASIARLAVPVRGPSGNALDLTCAGGTNVTIPVGGEWTCSIHLGTGYGQAGTFTFWDDWMGFDNVWHAGQLGPMKTFTLSP